MSSGFLLTNKHLCEFLKNTTHRFVSTKLVRSMTLGYAQKNIFKS